MQCLEVWSKHTLFIKFFSRSDTIKIFYSDREQLEELKMTTVLLQSP